MRNVFIVLIAVLASSVALADGPTVAYKYVDSFGTLSFTDDEDRVPAKYKATAEKVTLGALADYDRFTAVATVVAAPTRTAVTTVPAVTKRDCGTVTTRSERRDHDGFNSRFWIVEDDCGELYNATGYPSAYLELRR